MENNRASSPWGSDYYNSPLQSQWLQTTLADLDKKMKGMLTLAGEDGNSSAHKSEMYYKGQSELIQMLEECHRSYCSLAEKYDQLRTKSIHAPHSGSSFSPNPRKIQPHADNKTNNKAVRSPVDFDSHPESVVEDPDIECDSANFEFESPNKVSDELTSTGPSNTSFTTTLGLGDMQITGYELARNTPLEFLMTSPDQKNTWSELKLQVMRLMEENLEQQAELVRRNDENKQTIRELRCQLAQQKEENRALQSCLRCSKTEVKHHRCQLSILKCLILGKFFRGCSS